MDPLATILRQRNLISEEQLAQAQEEQHRSGRTLGRVCIDLGFAQEAAVMDALASGMGLERIDLRQTEVQEAAVRLVPGMFARMHRLVPVVLRGQVLVVAVADPLNLTPIDDVRFMAGREIRVAVATAAQIDEALQRHYPQATETVRDALSELGQQVAGLEGKAISNVTDLKALANQTPVVKLVDLVLSEAVARKASDIHVEPFEDELMFRYRVDGVCDVVTKTPRSLSAAVISRIKVMANLDVAESRVPQDGRIMVTVGERSIDLRVSTLPTVFGESVVLRVLDRSAVNLSLEQLGLDPERRQVLEALVERPHGMVLVTGPTGSGKTTTLYSCLRLVNRPEVKIITTEDPVEYDIDGIVQVPINAKIELTFARCLRSILRQDPDVIMVGEIRDAETAQIAVQAALTGHLVLSTLHTNDAAGAVTRLMDMGVEPFLITSTVRAVLAQRLVRRLCPSCRQSYEVSPDELVDLGVASGEGEAFRAWRASGCAECRDSGVRGRTGLFEMFPLSETIRKAILERMPLSELRALARREGMVTLREDGVRKVREGEATIEEVLRETQG